MLDAPTDDELQDFFEEVWQLAEDAADCNDQLLAPRLFELANEIAEWRNQLRQGRAAADR